MKLLFIVIFFSFTYLFSTAQKDSTQVDNKNLEETTFIVVEQMPEYPGGNLELRKHIAMNMEYPQQALSNGITGTIYVRFIVSKTGNVENIEIVRGIDPLLNNEAIRVIKTLKQFKPGMQGGKPVNVWFTIPISFKLD